MNLDKQDLRNLIMNNSNQSIKNKSLRVPILINYVPVMKMSKKPMFLTARCGGEEFWLEYSTHQTRNPVTIKESFESLQNMVYKDTYYNQIGCGDEVLPELEQFTTVRDIAEIQVIAVNSIIKGVNIVTTDFKAMRDVCTRLKDVRGNNPELCDRILLMCLRNQIALDVFLYYRKICRHTSPFVKIPNTVISGFAIDNNSLLRVACYSLEYLTNIDNLEIYLPTLKEKRPITHRVKDGLISIGVTSTEAQKPANTQEYGVSFSAVSMIAIAEDVGVASPSGITKYYPDRNKLLNVMMMDNYLYQRVFSGEYSLYNQTFVMKEVNGIITYEYSDVKQEKDAEQDKIIKFQDFAEVLLDVRR